MTREEAIKVIEKEYKCVDRDCDIERSCGKCDLMIPTKEPILEAYKMAIEALKQESCEDCVSRQVVKDKLNKCNPYSGDWFCESDLDDIPSVTPKPKTGHWTHDGSHWANRWLCSKCGYKLFDEQSNYCPNCGSRMER